jgi:hypothetical protein
LICYLCPAFLPSSFFVWLLAKPVDVLVLSLESFPAQRLTLGHQELDGTSGFNADSVAVGLVAAASAALNDLISSSLAFPVTSRGFL